MTWQQILEIAIGGLGAVALWILNDAVTQLRAMRESISLLNEKIAVVITKIEGHEKRIEKLEGQ